MLSWMILRLMSIASMLISTAGAFSWITLPHSDRRDAMKNVYEVLKDLGHEIPEELQQYYGNIEYWKQWWQGYVPKFQRLWKT